MMKDNITKVRKLIILGESLIPDGLITDLLEEHHNDTIKVAAILDKMIADGYTLLEEH